MGIKSIKSEEFISFFKILINKYKIFFIIILFIFLVIISIRYYLNLIFDTNKFLEILNTPNTILALLGLLISPFLGQYLTYRFQLNSFRHQAEEKKNNDFYQNATKLFDEMSSLMDRRLYLERKLLSSFRDRDLKLVDKVDERFSDYNLFLYEWNQCLNKNICRIEIYFGAELSLHFENRISKDFNWVGIMLRQKYFKQNDYSAKIISEAIDITNARVYKFDKSMLKIIRKSLNNY